VFSSDTPFGSTDGGLTPYTVSATGINATFIGFGATLTHLHVFDKDGESRDVVVGYDVPAGYPKDVASSHTYFGAVVG
jgi:aldose 1-epimerase